MGNPILERVRAEALNLFRIGARGGRTGGELYPVLDRNACHRQRRRQIGRAVVDAGQHMAVEIYQGSVLENPSLYRQAGGLSSS